MKKVSLFLTGLMCLLIAPLAFGQDHGGATSDPKAMLALAAGLAIGIGAFGGAFGQARAAAAALEGIARNPSAVGQIQTPMIIALALIESLVIYALIVAIMLLGKI